MYALDPPRSSFLARLADHPYPAVPQGLGLPESVWRASMHPAFVGAVSVAYLIAAKWANAARAKSTPRDRVKDTWLTQAVLAHNIFLALYSAWTSVLAIRYVGNYFAKGFAAGGFQGFVTAYCTVPTYETTSDAGATPFGLLAWLFYVSKLYEIVDSLILALKGKHVSSLQSYHHAGAMWTMWSGVRYSATPVWIFATFNSTIHAIMYSWFTATSLKLRAPTLIKRSITTLQITQLFVGFWVAFSYLFVTYRPSAFPQHAVPSIGTLPGATLSFAGSAASSNSTSILGKTSLSNLLGLDKYATQSAIAASLNSNGRATCVASTGQAFGVALNCAYLAPLIVLFVRFYLKSYIKRGHEADKAKADKAAKAQ